MQRIIISLLIIMTCYSLASAQQDTASAKQEGTTVITEWEDTQEGVKDNKGTNRRTNVLSMNDLGWDVNDSLRGGMGIAVLSIILIFGLPFFVIFLAFFFKYKNRRAKYKLIEQALASGQPLPENFLKDVRNDTGTRNKGITNIFTGLGLFIFLWALTGEFSIGSIGVLVMCIGFGQALIYYLQEPRNNKKDDNSSGY